MITVLTFRTVRVCRSVAHFASETFYTSGVAIVFTFIQKAHREYTAIITIEILANKKLAGESNSRNAHESLKTIGMPNRVANSYKCK